MSTSGARIGQPVASSSASNSGLRHYDQLWLTDVARGMVAGTLTCACSSERSIPATPRHVAVELRILRQLISHRGRGDGAIQIPSCMSSAAERIARHASRGGAGDQVHAKFPFAGDTAPMSTTLSSWCSTAPGGRSSR